MEKVIDLIDLLKHEILDLYSAEEQIIQALPLMIEKAGNNTLKAALKDHLKVTEIQKTRLDEIQQLLGDDTAGDESAESKTPGFFARLFGDGAEKCKGMEGLISEGKKMMSADMSPEASDAAIIASAQKIEHYEISGYGTARAFARELNLGEVANKLEQTLNEEYAADDLLTQLATSKVNIDAEFAEVSKKGSPGRKSSQPKSNARSNGSIAAAKKSSHGSRPKPNAKASITKSAVKKTPSKTPPKSSSKNKNSSSKPISPVNRNKSTARKSGPAAKKNAAKSSKGRTGKSSSNSKSSRAR